jgi:hypothetical protein
MRRKAALVILALLLLVDALAWTLTYRDVTAPSPEELQLRAGATPLAPPSVVEPVGDGLYAEFSLSGECRYRQAGSDLVGYFLPNLETASWRTMAIPQNWYLAGLNYHGVIRFRREFEADESWRGRVVRLRFADVDYLADVWLNGEPPQAKTEEEETRESIRGLDQSGQDCGRG